MSSADIIKDDGKAQAPADGAAGALPEARKKEEVTLRINGVNWVGWTSFEATREIDSICGQFALGLVDRWMPGMEALPIAAGMPCEVVLGEGDPLFNGYIDKVDFSLAMGNHAIQITGREKAEDLVDCSAVHTPGTWKGLKIQELLKELAKPFDITIAFNKNVDLGPPFPVFKLEEGETAFDAMDRALKLRELLVVPYGDGRLVITKLADYHIKTPLVQGENVLEASASYDMADRFSDYIVKGQAQGTDTNYGASVATVRGEARDESVERYRPFLVRAENQVDTASAIKRAKWEATTRAARSVTLTVKVRGWRREGDSLWDINYLVMAKLPYLRIKQELLISKVTYSLTLTGGTVATLELRDPKAFDPEPPKKDSKSGSSSGGTLGGPELLQASADSAWTAHDEKTGGL
ncbi:MAG: phage tail protein [Deltaproteobacteria bacterium]|nr:phage tail protein [Deltaproteobacteria bacterium]